MPGHDQLNVTWSSEWITHYSVWQLQVCALPERIHIIRCQYSDTLLKMGLDDSEAVAIGGATLYLVLASGNKRKGPVSIHAHRDTNIR